MASELSARQFGWQVVWRAGLFGLVVFGVPLLLLALDRFNGDEEETLDEAIRLTTGTPIALAFYVVFAVSMIRPCWRRFHALGWPRAAGFVVPTLLLLDWTFFFVGSGIEIFGPAVGSPGGRIPIYLLTSAILVMAMVVANRRPIKLERTARLLEAALVALLIAAFACYGYVVSLAKWGNEISIAVANGENPHPWFVPMALATRSVQRTNVIVCIAISLIALGLAKRSRHKAPIVSGDQDDGAMS